MGKKICIAGLKNAGWGLYGPGCLCSKIAVGLGVRPPGLAQNPGARGLWLLAYVVNARPGPSIAERFVCWNQSYDF
jgi:hypothetical protein